MTLLQATILGIVEGLTEFLPVSSTGHLILTNALLDLRGEAVEAYTVVIQLGAILAVLALYMDRALQMLRGCLGKDPAGLRLLLCLSVAFAPAVILGLALGGTIQKFLFGPAPVAVALIVGGVAMIVIERRFVLQRDETTLKSIEDITLHDALLIGCVQCFALWPGTSRSMATILGAQIRGLSNRAAAEFSFLLALPTLGGATIYELLGSRDALMNISGGMTNLLCGTVVAFVVALGAVRWFVAIVSRHGMAPFGVYRIILGIAVLVLVAMKLL